MKLRTTHFVLTTLTCIASLPVVSKFIGIDQGQPAQPDSSCQLLNDGPSEDLGDGVKCRSTIRLSKPLFDSEQGKTVRVLSFYLDFRRDLSVLSQADGLMIVDPEGHQPVTLSVGGVDPKVAEPSLPGTVTPHSYDIYIGPIEGKTWGAASGKGDVSATVVRTK